jgi:uncharacterized protein (DUF4415 family)
MKNTSETNWAKLDAMTESEIDTSDIPPLTEEFFNKSRWWKPVTPVNVLIQVDPQTLAWFQAQGDDYEKEMAEVLRIYAEAHQTKKSMQEVDDDELLSGDDAYSYYQSLKL